MLMPVLASLVKTRLKRHKSASSLRTKEVGKENETEMTLGLYAFLLLAMSRTLRSFKCEGPSAHHVSYACQLTHVFNPLIVSVYAKTFQTGKETEESMFSTKKDSAELRITVDLCLLCI